MHFTIKVLYIYFLANGSFIYSCSFFHTIPSQEETKKRLRLMSRRRRRRHKSFEIEMSYETLQLQTLQFCVMGYDEYSRQKVIGDVLLPLAELAQQGLDITRELVMWRDIQASQPVNTVSIATLAYSLETGRHQYNRWAGRTVR